MSNLLPPKAVGVRHLAYAQSHRFIRDDSGMITIFATFMLLLFLMVCGIAVDLMRNEIERTRLQNTLDRAIVAAADLDSELDAEAVVRDYFAKSGVGQYLDSVTVTPGTLLPSSHFRSVSATARARTPSPYMRMTGQNTLPVYTSGKAEEKMTNVEISLILDVSGSMNSNSRLTNLKIAAKDFVDQVLDNSQKDRLHITIIPYATQVSLPQHLVDQLRLTNEHNYSRCVNFSASDFASAGIDPAGVLERTMHFDPWSTSDGRDDDPAMNLVPRPVCEDNAAREMILFQNDATILKTYIENLSARGNTSIDIGMKWGAAMLDPKMRPTINALAAAKWVPAPFSDRPKAYSDPDTLKVIVLMTDGQNTSQYYIEDDHRRNDSEVYWNPLDEVYSMYDSNGTADPDDDTFYLRDANGNLKKPDGTDVGGKTAWSQDAGWNNLPYGCSAPGPAKNGNWDCGPTSPGKGTFRLSYADLWAYTSIKGNVENNYYPFKARSTANSLWREGVYDSVSGSRKDDRTKDICGATKKENVIVYTIGFEAPAGGKTVLQNCASSPAHFFDVNGLQIADAFTSIANEITQLRLTQ